MEQGNGHFEVMEARLQCGSLRYKSKVPRARGSHQQSPDYAECGIPAPLKRETPSLRDHLPSPRDHHPPARDHLLSPTDQQPTPKDYQFPHRDRLPSPRDYHSSSRDHHHPSSRNHHSRDHQSLSRDHPPKNHHPSYRNRHHSPRDHQLLSKDLQPSPRDYAPSSKDLHSSLREHQSSSKDLHPSSRDHQVMLDLGDTDEQKEWRQVVGQRVCISGVKQGTLRYFGRTNFAQGHWCGVELDEPVGKNDGTVGGVVYFACRPNHGIFAPVGKVSRLNDTWRPDSETPKPNDPGAWRSESVKQEISHWEYNMEESSEKKYIRNSISDPTFMQGNIKSAVPRGSESFSFDNREFAEASKTYVKQSAKHSSSSHSLSKYGHTKKNQYLSSNVITMGDNTRDIQPRQHNNGNGQKLNLTTTMEEYEQFLRTPTNSGQASPMTSETTAAKRFNEMPFYDYGKMPDAFLNAFQSHDFSDFEDEVDNDDQMSVDYDESLGILTPSQMKDLTLGADFPTSLSDIRGLDFPSSESFDDINDLPEDEQVHDVSVYRVSEPSTTRNLEVSKQNGPNNYNKNLKVDDKEKVHMSSTDKFLSSISQKDCENFLVDTRFTSTAPEELRFNSTDNFSRTYNVNDLTTAIALCDDQAKNADEEISDKYYKIFSKDESVNISRFQNNHELHSSVSVTQLPEADLNMMEIDPNPVHCNQSDNSKSKEILGNEVKSRQNCDSLPSAEPESNTTLKEKLTVSWEDCLSRDSECMFPHVERPESVYTVGSNDTGFQEDGELEVGMTTSIDSTTDETKRFSSASRDSCMVSDEVDVYKIAESNSTSGYSTGLSDSCCNDRADDDLSSKPLTDEEIQDSVEHCDSEDAFSFQENSLGKDGDMVNMESSEVTTENVTALIANDSTSDALCETMVEDSTLTEINELLMSPEEKSKAQNSPVADAKEMEVTVDQQPVQKVVKAQESVESKLSSNSPAQSTPERKSNTTRTRAVASTRNSSALGPNRTSRVSRDEDSEKKRQQAVVPKSPKKNVMSKIKAMIEATSCKSVGRSSSGRTEAEPVVSTRRTVSAPKKSRWEAVTSKIAASLAEEKTKPKARREIKSRVDTNLTSARQQVVSKSPLDSCRASNCGDGSMSPISVCSRDRRPLADKNSAPSSLKEGRPSLTRDSKQRPKSPRPGRITASRSASPDVAASESSTSIHSSSHNSKSKIAHWKGSNSTIASSVPPPPVNKRPPPLASTKSSSVTRSALTSTRMINKKPSTVPKIRITPSERSQSPIVSKKNERSKRHTRTKEHAGRGSTHLSTNKLPVRPPVCLSKAELTQEIQRLGTLCEARTKELNRLKMETKHVTVGFDAFAALFKYMVEDVNGLSVPKLSEDLEKTLKQLELAKQDLAYYEREVEEMKAHHCQELNDLSNKLFEVFQGEVTELGTKHQEEVSRLKHEHEKQLQATSETYKVGYEETQACHEAAVIKLQQELITQREELEMFHEKELQELEQKYCESSETLQEHIEQLQKKCAELKQHSLGMEDAMRKDTDSKLQWVTSRKGDLEKEVESLKAVLEMKNKELHTIRVQNLEMEKQLEELPLAREKIKMLSARAEDLEALMVEKTRVERKLSTENQTIRDTYEKESKYNKRLSMENEELQWRLRQAEQSIISGSFSEVTESAEELENCPLSPVKSPHQMSRSVFFTFVDKDVSSPRSQYKKITPGFSSGYKTSPSKSSAVPSPRKGRGQSESTPKKTASTLKQQRRQRASTAVDNGGAQSFASSMVSSVGSECSVFDQREELLEEHKEQIMESLEILREQRCSEENDDEPMSQDVPEQNGEDLVLEKDRNGDVASLKDGELQLQGLVKDPVDLKQNGNVPCQKARELQHQGFVKDEVDLKQNGALVVMEETNGDLKSLKSSESKTTWHDVPQQNGDVLALVPESLIGLERPVVSNGEKVEPLQESGSDPVTPSDKWQEEVTNHVTFQRDDEMSRSAEFSDPKTYYHMTFPVLKEAGAQDCDTEDRTKENFAPAQVSHSIVESSEVVSHKMQVSKEISLEVTSIPTQGNGASTVVVKVAQQNALSQSFCVTDSEQDSKCKEQSREKNRWRTM